MFLQATQSTLHFCGEQGWRSGENTRLPPMWRGFESQWRRRHMWGEFVVGSLLRFSPLLKKPTP